MTGCSVHLGMMKHSLGSQNMCLLKELLKNKRSLVFQNDFRLRSGRGDWPVAPHTGMTGFDSLPVVPSVATRGRSRSPYTYFY